MVDVSSKKATDREARARSVVHLPKEVVAAIEGFEIQSKKGPVFATAIIAGVMAAKKTHELIPFCHPLGLEKCDLTISVDGDNVIIECACRVHHKTGVEMEALAGASTASLTIYDMLKYQGKDMIITETKLLEKTGGKSGNYKRQD